MIIEVTLDMDELVHVVSPFLEDLITKNLQPDDPLGNGPLGYLGKIECRPIISYKENDTIPYMENILFRLNIIKREENAAKSTSTPENVASIRSNSYKLTPLTPTEREFLCNFPWI